MTRQNEAIDNEEQDQKAMNIFKTLTNSPNLSVIQTQLLEGQ